MRPEEISTDRRNRHVVWRMDPDTAQELADTLDDLLETERGHLRLGAHLIPDYVATLRIAVDQLIPPVPRIPKESLAESEPGTEMPPPVEGAF